MATLDSILKITNSKGRSLYFLGYNSDHTLNAGAVLQALFGLEDFDEETAEELYQKAEMEYLCFVMCTNPEDIKPEEVTLFIDFGKKTASLPPMDVQPIKEFEEDWHVKVAEIDGKMYVYWDEGEPDPIYPWPEEFKDLLDKEEAPIERVSALISFFDEQCCGTTDFIYEGRIIHCEEG